MTNSSFVFCFLFSKQRGVGREECLEGLVMVKAPILKVLLSIHAIANADNNQDLKL
jgi:hypothetical protein